MLPQLEGLEIEQACTVHSGFARTVSVAFEHILRMSLCFASA